MKRNLFIGLLLFICLFQGGMARAAHIVGGEIYYNYISGNSYRVYIILYRDCNSTGAAFDAEMSLGIYNGSNVLVEDKRIVFPGSIVLPITFNNPCIIPPNNICTEKAVYTTIVTLPPTPGGYTLVYQRCCRGPNISNLQIPDDFGITLQVHVPVSAAIAATNSSPRFKNFPPLVICNNDFLDFDHSATDPDGDQLIYSLATPLHGGSSAVPKPEPPASPPYSPVVWANGHNVAQQLGPGSNLQIDPVTGRLTGQPNLTGLYVVGVQVEERRNGVTVSKSIRDFVFNVIQCQITLNANIPQQQSDYIGTCDGLTVNFPNNSFGGTYYRWNFGVPGTNADTTNVFKPTFTFPSAGTYTIRFLAKKNNDCIDSAEVTLILNEPVDVNFTATDSVCVVQNSIDFVGSATNANGGTFSWNFGPNATPSTATSQNVMGVNFNQSGSFPVKFSYVHPHCATDTTIDALILDYPDIDFDVPLDYECDGLTVNFVNLSVDAINYSWDFGDPSTTQDVSNLPEPSYKYTTPGTHTIRLIAGSTGLCIDTVYKDVLVYDDLIMSIQSKDSVCITNNSFDFIGNVSGPDIATYSWNFGPNGVPTIASDTNVYGVSFDTPGNQLVRLTGNYLQCEKSVTKTVFLFREPTIDFTVLEAIQCTPFNAQFIDKSIADSPITYLWDLGNGQFSTLQNPTTVYVDTGEYVVTLTIETKTGCIAKLTKTRDDLVYVRPVPDAGFLIDREVLDVCDNALTLTDISEGGDFRTYLLGELNKIASNAPNPFVYNYQTGGFKTIELISSNKFGCSNSALKKIYVAPFVMYIPNAFTPDGDEFNNRFGAKSDLTAEAFHLRIFNRWGQLIWETFDQNASWDGTYAGKQSPQGIYHYIVDMTTCGVEDKVQLLKGTVFLSR
ncbi:MAG: PKD domain-containing protein [Bacteroidetes bacterium]|nr:PKD domain-containing protein [Bacteroidota bacterium]